MTAAVGRFSGLAFLLLRVALGVELRSGVAGALAWAVALLCELVAFGGGVGAAVRRCVAMGER